MKTNICSLALVILVPTGLFASSIDKNAGTRPSNIMTMQNGPRIGAMGGAGTAVADDIEALFSNPAGLARIDELEILATGWKGLMDLSANNFGLALPLRPITSSNLHNLGTFGANFSSLNYGNIDGTDINGISQGNVRAKDKLLSLGYGFASGRDLFFGADYKMYDLTIANETAKGSLIDAGLLFQAIPDHLMVGAALLNMGGGLTYGGASEKAPQSVSAGVAFSPIAKRLILAVDVLSPSDNGLIFKTGAEYWLSPLFALRAGYDSSFDAGPGVSGGIGLRLQQLEMGFFPIDQVMLNYSATPAKDFNYLNQISLSFRIGMF